MNKKILASVIVACLTLPLIALGAQTLSNIISRADQEITVRLTSLNNQITRIGEVKKLSDSEKNDLTTTLQNEISDLSTLKAKIDADTDIPTAMQDLKSITKSYRVYALVMPQAALVTASDRINYTADLLNSAETKVKSRISSLPQGTDTTAMEQLLTDFDAKVADAISQTQSATGEISGLQPDNGVTAVAQSNLATLKDARDKMKAAQQDLITARKDIGTVAQDLKAFEKPAQ